MEKFLFDIWFALVFTNTIYGVDVMVVMETYMLSFVFFWSKKVELIATITTSWCLMSADTDYVFCSVLFRTKMNNLTCKHLFPKRYRMRSMANECQNVCIQWGTRCFLRGWMLGCLVCCFLDTECVLQQMIVMKYVSNKIHGAFLIDDCRVVWFVAFWIQHAVCNELAVLWDCSQLVSFWIQNVFYNK